MPQASVSEASLARNFARPHFVSSETTQSVLAWPEVIGRLRAAYSVPHGPAVSPPRVVARGADRTWLRALAAVPPGARFMGAKLFGFGRQHSVSYLIALFEQENGALAALVDGNLVTAYRTAATSAVAVDRLAPPGPVALGVLGSGLEAQMHTRAIATVRPLRELRVYSPTPRNREAFAIRAAEELGVPCTPVGRPEEAVIGVDLVVAAARSHDESPILRGEWLKPVQMVVSIGSTLPDQREVDEQVVAAVDLIVCDMPEEVIAETGDMIAAAAAKVPFERKMISLNELMSGKEADARVAAARLPMYKSVGSALQDIVVAELAFECASREGLIEALPIGFLMKQT